VASRPPRPLANADISPFLLDQLALPQTDRLAVAFLALDKPDSGRDVLEAYDEFIARLDDEEFRNDLTAVTTSSFVRRHVHGSQGCAPLAEPAAPTIHVVRRH
jgi:hypothetical protein